MKDWYTLASQVNEDFTDEELEKLFGDKWILVDSSFIDAGAYSDLTGHLDIRMKDGREYTHVGVPKDVFEGFLNSSSKGAYYNSVLKKYKVENK